MVSAVKVELRVHEVYVLLGHITISVNDERRILEVLLILDQPVLVPVDIYLLVYGFLDRVV